MDKNPQRMTRLVAAAFFPIALAVLLPAALLVGLLAYVIAVFHGLLSLARWTWGAKQAPTPPAETRKPHFLEIALLQRRAGERPVFTARSDTPPSDPPAAT